MDSIAAAIFASEEEIEEQRNLNIERRILRDNCNPMTLEEKAFIKNFRLNKTAFKYVMDVVGDALGSSQKAGVTPMGHVVATLRFLAEGGYQHGVGKDFDVGMAQSTLSKVLKRSLQIMEEKLCPEFIKLEMTSQEKSEAKIYFFSRTRFPGIIMCVDGTHIKIIPPAEEKFPFYNRKGFYSINAMLICDHKMRIRFIDARYPGSNHDSHVWNISDAKALLERSYMEGDRNTWILGDAGYPLQPWLMTPFRSPREGSVESAYNKAHAKARNIVERTIGVLKNRFRCILGARQLHYSPKKSCQIVNVCSALHNICIHFGVEEHTPENPQTEDEDTDTPEETEQSNPSREAGEIRERIARAVQNITH